MAQDTASRTGAAASSSASTATAAATRGSKRRAEDEADDPRLDHGNGAEVVNDPVTKKRQAESPADDSARGDLSVLGEEMLEMTEVGKTEGASARLIASQNCGGRAIDDPVEAFADSHCG